MKKKLARKRARHAAGQPAASPSVRLLPLGAALMAGGLSLGAVAQETTTAAAAPKEKVLSTVSVNGQVEGVEDGYRASATRVGKTLQDPHDVPQAITTVTRSLMEEQQVGSLKEALRNVSGLTFNAAEGGRSGDNMMLRGFYTYGDIYLDGIRDTAQYNRETFNLEQVDVLRGAAAMLFGRGQAGGVINQVSKTPMLVDRNKITGSIGTEDYRELTGDFNKVLGDTTAVRLNVMKRDEGSWRNNPMTGTEPEIHREGAAASVGFGLFTDNELIVSHQYLRTDDNPDYGISFDNATHKPTKRYDEKDFWGIDQNFDESETNISTITHTYRFTGKTQLRSQLRYSNYKRAYWASAPSNTVAPSVYGNAPKTRKSDTDNLVLQSDFSTEFNALGMKHELVTGVEYLHEDSARWGLLNLNPTSARPYYSSSVVNPTSASKYEGDTYSVYAQDSVEFVKDWKVVLGARRDFMNAEYTAVNSPELKFNENSYRAGLSWQPSEYAHYYLSWSDSFSPTADLYQLSGGEFPPERSDVVELGAKFMFFEGNLAFRTALYRATKDWERNNDLESTASILTRKRRTDGLEFELAGRITDDWEVFAGLALMDSEILKVAINRNATTGVITSANPNFKGERARNTPRYTFNFWSTYNLGSGWKVGGGAEGKGERYGYNPSSGGTAQFNPNKAPAYVRWDAMVAYEQPKWAVRLNLRNLFDKVYYDAIYDNGGFTVPGVRRSAVLTTEFKF